MGERYSVTEFLSPTAIFVQIPDLCVRFQPASPTWFGSELDYRIVAEILTVPGIGATILRQDNTGVWFGFNGEQFYFGDDVCGDRLLVAKASDVDAQSIVLTSVAYISPSNDANESRGMVEVVADALRHALHLRNTPAAAL